MDPTILSNYEIVHETLSCVENESEINSTLNPDDSSCPKKCGKRKIIKNFIICQPIAHNNNNTETASINYENANTSYQDTIISSNEYNSERTNNINTSPKIPDEVLFNDNETVSTELKEENSTNNFGRRKKKEKCTRTPSPDDVLVVDQELEANSERGNTPSLGNIGKVTEQTVNKDLQKVHSPLNGADAAVLDTIKKCPYCKFNTYSKFSFQKHVALHKNKPQVIFTQGISTNQQTTNLHKHYRCLNCNSFFKTGALLKCHTQCCKTVNQNVKPAQLIEKSENQAKKRVHNCTQTDEAEFEPVIATAQKSLNQKTIDSEVLKERISLQNNMITSGAVYMHNGTHYLQVVPQNVAQHLLVVPPLGHNKIPESSPVQQQLFLVPPLVQNKIPESSYVTQHLQVGPALVQNKIPVNFSDTQHLQVGTALVQNKIPVNSSVTQHLQVGPALVQNKIPVNSSVTQHLQVGPALVQNEIEDSSSIGRTKQPDYVDRKPKIHGEELIEIKQEPDLLDDLIPDDCDRAEEPKLEHYEIILENVKKENNGETTISVKKEIAEEITDASLKSPDGGLQENLSSYDDLERQLAILTGEEPSVADLDLNGFETTINQIKELPVEIKSDEQTTCITAVVNAPDKTTPDETSAQLGKITVQNPLKDLQVNWPGNSTVLEYEQQTKKPCSDEKIQFDILIDEWLKSYKKLYPKLTARVHVPGGISCPNCHTYYKSFHLMRRHWARIHDPGLPLLNCQFCDYKTSQKELLTSHLTRKHNLGIRKYYTCNFCEKVYQSSSRLIKHKLIHHSDRSNLLLIKCDMCKFTTFDKTNLSKHYERKHLNTEKFLCRFCGILVKSKFTLFRHEMLHEGNAAVLNCTECEKKFEHRLDLYTHKKLVHSPPIYFNCELCEFSTLNKELFVVHDNVMHRNRKEFKCADCPLLCNDLASLSIHITRKHNPYIPWKYCANCSYKSLKKSSIVSHSIKHLPRKAGPIKCKLCKYRTYKPYYFKRHYNIRHNPDAIVYQCYHCSYVSKVKAKLHQHVQEKGHVLT